MDGLFIIAVHSLVYLRHMNCYVSSKDLAKNVCTNPARIRKAMSLLRAKGLIEAKEGLQGGYRVSTELNSITLKDIAAALHSSFALPTWRGTDFDKECLISTHMKDVMDDLGHEMDKVLYGYLGTITIDDIEKMIMTHNWAEKGDADK